MNQSEINVKSPLTNGIVKLITEFKTSNIIHSYQSDLGISLGEVFKDYNKIGLYQCIDSGYEFYFPFDIAGKEGLYKELANFDWYYNPWKWEHKESVKYIDRSYSILEIGCGAGGFLKNLKHRFPQKNITGLEITLNSNPENFILNETIQDHVAVSDKLYDLVCTYQVLEHIADVHSFLQSSVDALRPGGYLIISVPNNDGLLLKKKGASLLNLPPHHMGLWNKGALEFLTKVFPLNLIELNYEPIQDYHFEWFKNIIRQKMRKYNSPLIYRLTANNRIMYLIAYTLRWFYRGHTIMFVYQRK